MNILHITNEFSKKNYSIASIIFYISKIFSSEKNNNLSVVASRVELDLFDQKQIEIHSFVSWINFFFKNSSLKKKNK